MNMNCAMARCCFYVYCGRGFIDKNTTYMYVMYRYIENAVKNDGDNDEIVKAKVRSLMAHLGLDTLSEITESIFVRQLLVAYQRDPGNTARATKKALRIMRSLSQKVFDHVRLICRDLFCFAC